MTTMMRWDPFQDLRSAQDEMAQMSPMLAHALGLHARQQGNDRAMTTAWAPALDISERKDAYLVTVELPGVEAEDLDITMEDGLLTIKGERQFTSESSEQQFHRVERRYGAFRRSITLPAQVQADHIEATFDNGVLQIVVPKAEEAKPKRIQVRPGSAKILTQAVRTPPPAEPRGGVATGDAPLSTRSRQPSVPTPTQHPPLVCDATEPQQGETREGFSDATLSAVPIGPGHHHLRSVPDRHLHQLQRALDPRRPPATGDRPDPGTLADEPRAPASQQPSQHPHARSPRRIPASCVLGGLTMVIHCPPARLRHKR